LIITPRPTLKSIRFLEYSLAVHPMPNLIVQGHKTIINTINQYSYCMAEEDLSFKTALVNSDILLPDGIGIVKACSFLNGISIDKIAGADIHKKLLNELNGVSGKCFYLGASNHTLGKISKRIGSEFSSITVGGYAPPFKKEFDIEDIVKMIEAINEFQPDVVFIGLTAPKQEKLAEIFRDTLDTKVICSIGAVFDFYAKTIERPSQFWIDLQLEWFIRLMKEPRRLWKRYLYFGIKFVYYIMKEKIANLVGFIRSEAEVELID
jgi:N-acetylglucosaminyldiphosphoundecaprenol N-acetyl-beta-D-mannosaminyltransferase